MLRKEISNIKVWRWIGFVAALFLFPQVWNYYKKMVQNSENIDAKNAGKDAENTVKIEKAKIKNDVGYQQQKAVTITSRKELHAIAANIATFFGVNEPWYSYKYYTENDEGVYKEIMKMPYWTDLKIVARLYNQCYAVGRNLQEDCANLLDESYFNKIKW